MTPGLPYLLLVPGCAAASVLGFLGLWKEEKKFRRAGEWIGLLCFAVALLTWLARWRLTGHMPVFGTYESALSLAVAVLAATLVVRARTDSNRIWPVTCLIAAGLLAHGYRFDDTAFPLTISERSWVVDVHALLAWSAFGCLAANAGLAALVWRSGERTPERTSRLLSQSLSLGFMLHTAMMVSGSFYKFLLFGEAWSFDPIETLGFTAWVAYGTLLHMHLLAGWEGARLAKSCLVVFALLVVSYRFIVYFPAWSTYHILDMDLRMHIDPSKGM
jgi:ABC-type transport system involved in cytochrome c biogenesis permease subunit